MKNRNYFQKVSFITALIAVAAIFLAPIFYVSAQTESRTSDSAAGMSDGTPTDAPVGASAPAVSTGTAATPRPDAPATTSPLASTTSPVLNLPVTVQPQPATTVKPLSSSSQTIPAADGNAEQIALPVEQKSGESNSTALAALAVIALAGALMGLASFMMRRKIGHDTNGDERNEKKCDEIKSLLDQKKKELEKMARDWPEEKMKKSAKDSIVGALKKDEDARKAIELAEHVKNTYDKLKGTIEMLQKRYDLCMLSFGGASTASFKGTIVENSLNDKTILENLKIIKKYQVKDWLHDDVLVNEKQIEKLGEYLQEGPWFMHFWQSEKDDAVVVFRDKNFRIKSSDRTTWKGAIEYGKQKDIPEEQLNFQRPLKM